MPTSPKTPCRYPGCPVLTHERFCDEHQKKTDANYNKYQRDPDYYKRYGRNWQRIRTRYIMAHPLCEECKKAGRLTPAKEVHHVVPLLKGGTHYNNNLMSLCKSCHSAITARESSLWG